MSRISLLAGLFSVFLFAACGAETPSETREGDGGPNTEENPDGALTQAQVAHLEKMVTELAETEGYPNLVIGLIQGDELIWHHAIGAGPGPGQPLDADTLFRVGSVTKVVTATTLLRLADEGKLSLYDEAALWLPEAEAALSPPGRPPITLRHLLSHASGLPPHGYPGVDWAKTDPGLTESDIFTALSSVNLRFDPGTAHEYSNMNSVLVGLVIERATKQSFRHVVQERVLGPLGMSDAVWDRPRGRLAGGHTHARHAGYNRLLDHVVLGILEPAGGLYASVRDLSRLVAHGLGRARVLDAATLAASQTPQSDATTPTKYGLGWLLQDHPALGRVVFHDGSILGYGSFLALLPKHDLGVIVLAGTNSPGDVQEFGSLGLAALAHLVAPEAGIVPTPSRNSPQAVATIGSRILKLATTPSLDLVYESFSPTAFGIKSADMLFNEFMDVVSMQGGCTSYEVFEDRGASQVADLVFHLECANGRLSASTLAEPEAPYRMHGVLLQTL